ncbi:MAG TPA: DUF4435 domain-containing protein [Candidatus Deferrimicrobium sp.]|nr:DUF4435 domain-containing protein [Candidatus Deferrimicrobium sp.]
MSKLRNDICERIVGNAKKAVLVEGEEDQIAYELLFGKKYSNWENHLLFYPVDGKNKVINELKKSSDFIGIIDKDEWSGEDIAESKKELPNLIVIPRYCMESYLVDPEEIWQALPPNRRKEIKYDDLRNAILEDLENWTRHAALWHAVLPLYPILKKSGFNQILLNHTDIIKNEEFIKEKLNEWHNILDPDNTYKKYLALFSEINSFSLREKLHQWIHGKKFWEQHVSKKLVFFFGQEEREKYAAELWEYHGIPGDWEEIWAKIENFQPALKLSK